MAEGFQKWRRREAKLAVRRADRARLRELRERVRALRARRRATLTEIRANCKAERERVRAEAIAIREETKRRLRETLAAMREAQRGTCRVTRSKAREALTAELVTAADELGAERRRQAMELELDRSEKRRERSRTRTTAKERRQESDDEVRGNLTSDLIPVFDAVRSKIKARPRMSRTEAFLHWAHDNPGEVLTLQEAAGEHAFLEELRKHEDELRRMRRRRRLDRPAQIAAGLAGVPF